ncbi:unnamed protein product [Prunus brigantina]
MIHLLPTYYGNTTEDPYMHIKQFFEICATIKIQGLDDEQIKMRLFPFSLKDKAKSWLYSLPNASIHTWEELSNKFLQKFFPAQKTNKIRQEILRFTQKEGEAFHECWERYKEMIRFQIQQRQFQQAPQQVQEQKGDQMGELQDMFKKFMGQQMQTNQNLQNAVNKLEVQVGQIASSLSNRASGTFPSQTEVNPRHQEHAKAVHILRSGKQVDNKVGDANEEQEDGENVEILQPPHGQPTGSTKQPLNAPGKSTGPKVSSNANQLILPADFLVLEMEEAPIHDNQLPLILGRPFMATAGAIIDVKKGTLTMNVFDETIAFKVFEASKFPSDEHELVCSMDSYIEVGKRYANQFESLPPPTNKVLPSIVQAPSWN